MNYEKNIILILSNVFMIFNWSLKADESHNEDPHYEWFKGDDIIVHEDGIYADSNKGLIKLNVVDYDRINDRYKVLCCCLQKPKLDPCEALSDQSSDAS